MNNIIEWDVQLLSKNYNCPHCRNGVDYKVCELLVGKMLNSDECTYENCPIKFDID